MKAFLIAILLAGCATPRVIERVRTVEVAVPVAAPCPRPEDVRPLPTKPGGDLPEDARAALAVMTGWALDLWAYATTAEAQIAACSSPR
jgi:hypothetical protein